MSADPYKRVLLKISGEALKGEKEFGYDFSEVQRICKDIKKLHDAGVEVSIVVGGGNIFRGVSLSEQKLIDRASCDYMGMLGTIMNALAIQSVFDKLDVSTRVCSAIPASAMCEQYIRRRAIRHMEKGRIVICAAGTGNPFFSTDTAAALRAVELNCDVLMKATQVDGVYTADPKKDQKASKYKELSYKKVLEDGLSVMDASAITLARENKLPVVVFSIHNENSVLRAACSQGEYTIIK
ncbi:MAG: UMP kinase [Rickettsiales bacterium]